MSSFGASSSGLKLLCVPRVLLQTSSAVGHGGEREASAGNLDGGGSVHLVSQFGVLLVSQRRRYAGWFAFWLVCGIVEDSVADLRKIFVSDYNLGL